MNGSKRRTVLGVLLALQGIGAIGGAIFVVPNLSIDNLKTAIFPDYTIPAVGLGVLAGLAVMLYEIVEVTAMKGSIFTDPGRLPLWQQPLWFLIGAAIVVLAGRIPSTRPTPRPAS